MCVDNKIIVIYYEEKWFVGMIPNNQNNIQAIWKDISFDSLSNAITFAEELRNRWFYNHYIIIPIQFDLL